MPATQRPLALVTGASTGIGLEFAKICVADGFDLVVCANEPAIEDAATALRASGRDVLAVEADLSTREGVDRLHEAAEGRRVDVLFANAGTGLGAAFLDQDFDRVRHIVDTNVTGTLHLIHRVGRDMRERGSGRILVTGSIAGFVPGSFNAVYNASKAFVNAFAYALRNEMEGSGVTVTCLMPGATDTAFFRRAGMEDTGLGQAPKDDPAMVARVGFDAMMEGEAEVSSGLKNKIMSALANVTPAPVLAKQHRKLAEPGSGSAG